MSEELTIIVPLPAAVLNPNRSRVHWSKLSKATKIFREAGYYAAMNAINRAKIRTPFAAVTIESHFYFPHKRRRDKDNCAASLKAIQDGLVDAGLVSDDEKITNGLTFLVSNAANPRVELLVRSTDA